MPHDKWNNKVLINLNEHRCAEVSGRLAKLVGKKERDRVVNKYKSDRLIKN